MMNIKKTMITTKIHRLNKIKKLNSTHVSELVNIGGQIYQKSAKKKLGAEEITKMSLEFCL